ncbi:hypothetical protein GCM10010277_78390 [Streptomyces longisporoflavus]|nr:hypothetical protein GCM10010277_78390 [Streptomyces longisporoflavus]
MSDSSDHTTIRHRLAGRLRRPATDDRAGAKDIDDARLRDTVRSTEDAVHHALGPIVDVEQSLAALKQRLEQEPAPAAATVLDRVPALVALVQGPEHRLAYANDAYTQAFGVRPAGVPARDGLPELEELGLLPLLDQVLRSGKPRTVKSRKAAGGRWYTVTCTRVTEGGDEVMVFATDVTDHAEAAERLRASERRQRETAMTLQRSLLPQELEQPEGLRIAATYQPGGTEAAVGGDWYDVINLGGARTALVIGDVMGRGIRAAAVMGQLRTAVRAYASLDLPPPKILQLLDALLTEIDPHHIATCVYAVHDPEQGGLVYASAGHLPILVRDQNGMVLRADEPTGPPLGTGGWTYTAGSLDLAPGSTAVLYTNGLTNHRDRDPDEAITALARALATATARAPALESGAGAGPQVICDRLLRAAGVTGDNDDDAAILVLQRTSTDSAAPSAPPHQ